MTEHGTAKEAKDAANMRTGNYADAKPYDRGTLNKLHYGIQKPHSPSVFDRVYAGLHNLQKLASHLPLSSTNRFIRARNAAQDEYKKWQTEHKDDSDEVKTAKLDEYIERVKQLRRKYGDLKGGKKRSRKSRKNRKTRSRKNRKTRSRK
jgi:hypothetical protein